MIKEYECKDCGKVIEIWERFDEVPDKCPRCCGELVSVISKSTFHLKGDGWAVDGYCPKRSKASN
jgi:putative FmdB family regulatory protein